MPYRFKVKALYHSNLGGRLKQQNTFQTTFAKADGKAFTWQNTACLQVIRIFQTTFTLFKRNPHVFAKHHRNRL